MHFLCRSCKDKNELFLLIWDFVSSETAGDSSTDAAVAGDEDFASLPFLEPMSLLWDAVVLRFHICRTVPVLHLMGGER